MREFDYVVVGGGTAGAILARRLADAGCDVALLEAGPSDEGDGRVLELRRCIEVMDSELDWDYRVVPQAVGNSRAIWNRARVLGGCSSHNAGIAFKTPDHDLRAWEARGATGWGPADVAGCFERIWAQLPCEYGNTDNAWEQAAVTAATEWGVPRVEFGREDHTEGAGFLLLHKQGPYRTSSSISYLHPLDALPSNLSVILDCEASTLLFDDDGRATGVATNQGRIAARREVIVAGGVINSPKLLMLSGIGPAAHLRDVGIEVRADLPVGDYLSDHAETVLMWESTRPVPLESAQDWECTALVKSEPGLEVGDLIVNFGPIPYDLYTVPYGCPTLPPGQAFSIAPYVARPRSLGTVRLASADPADKPLVDPASHTDAEGYDTATLVRAIRIARELVQQPALRDWVARELAPGPAAQDDEALAAYVRATGNTTYHPVGTCRMGAADDPRVVVGPDLRVRGVEGLRVADASVFPTHVGVNPVITAMMVGERAADLVLGRPAVSEAAASIST